MLVISALVAVLLMGDAIATRRGPLEATIQEKADGLAHGSPGASGDLNIELLEKTNSAITHAAAEHDIRLMLTDELGNHARLMTIRKRIGDRVNVFDFVVFYIHQGVIRATAKMMADGAI